MPLFRSARRSETDLAAEVSLLSGRTTWSTEGIEAQGLAPIVLADGPHGVRRTLDDAAVIAAAPSTCFPTAAGLASTWDRELIAEVGEAIGREAKAQGVSVVLGPGANIKRHPYGGRNFEYFSEDPLLSGELAAGMIDGIQRAGVGACLKHFVANNQESGRMTVDVVVDDRALREIYLAGFERAVRAAQPWMVMCAYNRLNGVYCSDDRWLLTEVLREEWGFEGIVVTDWGAMNDRVLGVRAGLDLEMPGNGGLNDRVVVDAVESGELAVAELHRVTDRLVTMLERGNRAVDRRAAESPAPIPVEMADDHHELACAAAAESAVLLTNDGILPVEPVGQLAVIGAFAVDPRFQGAGSSQVTPTRVDSLLDAVRRRIGDDGGDDGYVSYAAGYETSSDVERQDLLDEATLVARAADVAVVVVGLPAVYESEGFDREHLRLPEQHQRLVRAVADVNPNTVVVLMNGSPVQLPWIDRPRAVLEAYLGGQGGGEGVARVLFGEVEPGGRLAETFPLRATDHGSDASFPGSGRRVEYRESVFVGYRWFDTVGAPVLFPFGHGLGYTTFSFDDLVVDLAPPGDTGRSDGFGPQTTALRVGVDVTNDGDRPGAEVVQVYARRPDSVIGRARQELVGFAKVRLAPGERTTVAIEVSQRSLAHWDIEARRWVVEAGTVEIAVGASSRDIRACVSIELPGTGPVGATPAAPRSRADLADDDRFRRLLGRPIPGPEPVEPFHRNSTLEEVSVTGLGRGLRAGAVRAARRQLGDVDPVTEKLIDRMMSEAPLRAIALLGGGRLSWANLDRMIAAMNAARRVRRPRRRS